MRMGYLGLTTAMLTPLSALYNRKNLQQQSSGYLAMTVLTVEKQLTLVQAVMVGSM
jgi:hypothetical protein